MVATKQVLQGFRDRGYDTSSEKVGANSGDRTLPLTPEESGGLSGDGEICLRVYGTLVDGGLQVNRVEPEQMNQEDGSVPAGPPNRAMPSPS